MGPSRTDDAFARALDFHRRGMIPDAERAYRDLLDVHAEHAEAWHLLGLLLAATERLDEAAGAIMRAVSLSPKSAAFHANLCEVNRRLGRLDAARDAGTRAVALEGGDATAHNNYGMVLKDSGALEEAAHSFRTAVTCAPGFAQAHLNLATTLLELRRVPEALAAARRAVVLAPASAEAHSTLGMALLAGGEREAAVTAGKRAVELAPDVAATHVNLGISLAEAGQGTSALREYEVAIRLAPAFAQAHFLRAIALLLTGRFREGWAEYDWRTRYEWSGRPLELSAPMWDGAPLRGRTILLHAEQGLGDTIQFVRYATFVAERGGEVLLLCQPPLARLLRTVRGVRGVVTEGDALPAFDVHCPLLTLPRIFGTDLSNIPAPPRYLHADPAEVESWRLRMPQTNTLRVGVAWAGGQAHRNDHTRSLRLGQLGPVLTEEAPWPFYSLQKGPAANEIGTGGFEARFVDLTAHLHDFSDTAALVENLDLVISVDTAVAHLAGALGKPTWLLLPSPPDWRWLLERNDTPWYPSVRLFRQRTPGNWSQPIHELADALRRHVSNSSG